MGFNGGTTTSATPAGSRRAQTSPASARPAITVVTNALNIATEMVLRPFIRCVTLGGVARQESYELSGPLASMVLNELARHGVPRRRRGLGAGRGDVPPRGRGGHQRPDGAARRPGRRGRHGREGGPAAFARICPTARIDVLVTDKTAPDEEAPARRRRQRRTGLAVAEAARAADAGTGHDAVAAVDVGGTRIKAALVDRSGRELVSTTVPTPHHLGTPGALVDAVAGTVETLQTGAEQGRSVRLAGAGVVVPGLVDDARGVAVFSANLGWRDLEVVAPLESVLGVPVALGHDEPACWPRCGGRCPRRRERDVRAAGHRHRRRADGRRQGAARQRLCRRAGTRSGRACGAGAAAARSAAWRRSAPLPPSSAYAQRCRLDAPVGADTVASLVAQGDPAATEVWAVR